MPLNTKYQCKWHLFLRKIAQAHKAYGKNYCLVLNEKTTKKSWLLIVSGSCP